MNSMTKTVPLKVWIQASRPRTLVNSVSPVIIASALAYKFGGFSWLPGLLCLVFAVSAQVLANYANDYFDFIKGADTKERIGPQRVTASGLVSLDQMRIALVVVTGFALISGLCLVPFGGWMLIIVGVLSLLSAVAYTGGPYPLGYHGLGDFFVFLFFGLVAVVFTFYVQTGFFHFDALWVGAAYGLMSVNVLAVASYRDIETDVKVGKKTLAVRYGRAFIEAQILFGFIIAVLIPFLLFIGNWPDYSLFITLPLLLIIPVIRLVNKMRVRRDKMQADIALKSIVKIVLFYSTFLSLGFIFSR